MPLTCRTTVLCAALALGAATSSAAIPSAAWAQADRSAPHPPRPEFQAMREAHERQRAQDLRTILRLRSDQEPALTAFLQSHKPPMPPAERRAPPGAVLTTPQRLDEDARREAEHAQMRQGHTDAVRAFYAALSPDQRPVFDALTRVEGRGRGHGGWGHGHGFGGPEGGPPDGPPRG
ncbi:Spy/CpxP family protein refolding chaperone [Phenylobacterium sp.]|uniref:Spy/CpxP family protein refolding chaperone n=1 Tax=Phenylobacterium sp. TaxID=1871053 RepID=UPI003561EB99